jgi:hypothetical protein
MQYANDGSTPGCQYCGYAKPKTLDSGTLAASLAVSLHDVPALVANLRQLLTHAFPQNTRIEESGFFTKTVSAILVEVKTNTYRLGIDGGRAHATRTKIVRGVKLKDETLPLGRFVEELARDLSAMAEENQYSADALKRFLGR